MSEFLEISKGALNLNENIISRIVYRSSSSPAVFENEIWVCFINGDVMILSGEDANKALEALGLNHRVSLIAPKKSIAPKIPDFPGLLYSEGCKREYKKPSLFLKLFKKRKRIND